MLRGSEWVGGGSWVRVRVRVNAGLLLRTLARVMYWLNTTRDNVSSSNPASTPTTDRQPRAQNPDRVRTLTTCRHAQWLIQNCDMPPSTTTSVPVINDESSLARNSTAFAISRASPKRPSGMLFSMLAAASFNCASVRPSLL